MLLRSTMVADAFDANPKVKPATQIAPITRLTSGCFKIDSILWIYVAAGPHPAIGASNFCARKIDRHELAKFSRSAESGEPV